jgi:UbiD family decarboxylase
LRREAAKIGPLIVSKGAAPVKEIVQTGEQVDLYELPLLKHHEMDGGPYIDMSSVANPSPRPMRATRSKRMSQG